MALMAETSIQLGLGLTDPLLYLMAFSATILFYNYPYSRIKNPANPTETIGTGLSPQESSRITWYLANRRAVTINNGILIALSILLAYGLFLSYGHLFHKVTIPMALIVAIFPLAGILYYGVTISQMKLNLRRIGWFKPFLIGFVWAGMTYIYPLSFAWLQHEAPIRLEWLHYMLFAKSVMYIAMLAILFDIKDFASDQRQRLGTFVVRLGLKKTLIYIIIPLTVLGLVMFFTYAFIHDFSLWKIGLTMIPFLLLIASTLSFRKKRSLLYYLIVIDGLMMLKALFSSVAIFI